MKFNRKPDPKNQSQSWFTCCLCLVLSGGLAAPSTHAIAQQPQPALPPQVYFDYPLTHGKQQQLEWTALPRSLAIQMQLRGRTEGQTSYNLAPGNDRVYELTRVRGALEYMPFSTVTASLEFQDTHALGLPIPSVAADMRDQFDLFNGYLDLHSKDIHLITGRQPLTFGSQRLVGVADWSNNSRSWDGFDASIGHKTRLELFSTSVVQVHPTSLDKHGAGLTFHGAVVTIGALDPRLEIQPFLYIRTPRHVVSQDGVPGNELETTFGSEFNGTEKNGFDFDVLAALQRGSFSNDSIHAGAAYVKVGYLLRRKRWQPRFVAEYDYATGDARRNASRVSTFDQQYPSNHDAFGLVDLLGFQNIMQTQGDLDLTPAKHFTVRIQGETLHLANPQDNVYASDGSALLKSPQVGFASTHLGAGLDISSTYTLRQYILIEAGVGHLFPGPVLTASRSGPPLTLGYLQLTYRFKAHGPRKPGQLSPN